MGINKKYESNPTKAYANSDGQVVSRTLFGVVERGDMPLNSGFGEDVIIEVEPSAIHRSNGDQLLRVRVDTVPQDTITTSPDTAAEAADTMLSLKRDGVVNDVGFRAEYRAD